MALYRVTVTRTIASNGLRLEPGMYVDIGNSRFPTHLWYRCNQKLWDIKNGFESGEGGVIALNTN